jgi:hypothetical protein
VWPHGRHTERRWSHSHLSPTDTLYSASRYGSALAELNSTLTPCSAGWCAHKGSVKRSVHSVSDRGKLILQAQVKPQHLGSENRPSRDTLRSAPLSPIPDQLFRAHPRQKYPKCLLMPVLSHSRQEPLFPSQRMHREAQRIYTLIYIYSSRTIKDRIFKVGSARFINMHIR